MKIAYTAEYLNWQLGKDHPTNPVRAKNAVELLDQKLKFRDGELLEPTARPEWEAAVREIHDAEYVDRILHGSCGEWGGFKPLLGRTALTMFGGTHDLVELLLNGEHGVFFNPQGAKHHAQYNHSAGFCVFNDMAWAAKALANAGRNVVYIDWDIHHGDGVENLLRDRSDIWTFSVHDSTIYPGTGHENGAGFMNFALPGGAGDQELLEAVEQIVYKCEELEPDMILLACGADGLANDPLSSTVYTHSGLHDAAVEIGELAAWLDADVLVGGAGGYLPHDETPQHWADCIETLVKIVENRN